MNKYWLSDNDPRVKLLNAFLDDKRDGSFFITHAAVLSRIDGKLFMIDGVLPKPFFMESWYLYPLPVLTQRLVDSLDAAMISHCHDDHYDIELMHKLKPGTPVYVTAGRTGFEKIKAETQINLIEIPPHQRFPFCRSQNGQSLEVYAMPSDHNSLDSSFIVRGKNFSVFQGNDNFLDLASVKRGREAMGSVDHAYLPYAYIWWYPFCLTSMERKAQNKEIQRLNELNMKIGVDIAQALDARMWIPSAANMIFNDHANSVINRGIASQFDFVDYARKFLPADQQNRALPLMGGDYILTEDHKDTVVTQGITPEQHFADMDKFLHQVHRDKKSLAMREQVAGPELASVQERLKASPAYKDGMTVILRRNDNAKLAVTMDLKSQKAEVVNDLPQTDRYLLFDVQPEPFELWLEGKMNMEGILNSQRFTVYRHPETFERPVWDIIRTYL